MIGVAVTVHNRHDVAKESIKHIKRLLPENSMLVIVDDCSDIPFPNADFRFDRNAGIAQAKNKCIELLKDCDHIFLFDDDTYPIKKGWAEKYIEAGEDHLCYMFATTNFDSYEAINGLRYWNVHRGCMLYMTKDLIERIGGFDNRFIQYNWEHIDFSQRASKGCIDVDEKVIRSLDEDKKVETSVDRKVRLFELYNKLIYHENKNLPEYRSFEQPEFGDVILTFHSTMHKCPRLQTRWPKTVDSLLPLINSCRDKNIDLKIFYDSINQPDIDSQNHGNIEFIRIPHFNGYHQNIYRRIVFYEYLKYRHHKKVFMVDGTDVEVLKNPFESVKKGQIYVGSEETVVDCGIIKRQGALLGFDDFNQVFNENKSHKLLNAGIIGGYYDDLIEFVKKNSEIHREYSAGLDASTDMAAFNYVALKWFKDKIITGEKVHTKFMGYEHNDKSWFKHK